MNSLPNELVLLIIKQCVAENPQVSNVSQLFSATTRDLRIQQLRETIQSISHIRMLMKHWPPPLFSRTQRGVGQTTGGHITQPHNFFNLVLNNDTYDKINHYLLILKNLNSVAATIAEFVMTLNEFRHGELTIEMAQTAIIYLWTAQVRYGHDVNGYVRQIKEEYGADYYIRDDYVRGLPPYIQHAMMSIYYALCSALRNPSLPIGSRTQNLCLYIHIVRVSKTLVYFLARMLLTGNRGVWKAFENCLLCHA